MASLDPRFAGGHGPGATNGEAFRRITLPLVAPGIAAAALLAFSLSFDDFIITNFNSGQFTTFPKFVYVGHRGIPPQARDRHSMFHHHGHRPDLPVRRSGGAGES